MILPFLTFKAGYFFHFNTMIHVDIRKKYLCIHINKKQNIYLIFVAFAGIIEVYNLS